MGSWGNWGGPWGGFPPVGPWGGVGGGPGRSGKPGPPPWLTGLFGLAQPEPPRGPRARRGDVRAAILDVLRGEPMNGYQVMQQIAERSGGAWKPSPGSVYPTIQQLEDEGLIEGIDGSGQRKLKPTTAGWHYIDEHREELEDVWRPFERSEGEERGAGFGDLKPEIGQVLSAVWQIITQGSDRQRREAVAVLVETRRRLYGILAEGDDPTDPGSRDAGGEESDDGTGDGVAS
ncbi:PadR family transcriptional regulator [Nocardioides panaciterrulae]|uniref:DNA-binding PadR family transcriptional regulator n=1 Tax=Nocardioides panaciterrulae TaxID=661492 RepID=A0A7Y9J928_9ACTN|nr:PadR family transcriptional regulator [Nocardioides panaciterrulae]NYD40090.1 DNA-binding PadR family transcriptional regulator [Nocardioides panaciterrulae]